jgi:hypothetical protein
MQLNYLGSGSGGAATMPGAVPGGQVSDSMSAGLPAQNVPPSQLGMLPGMGLPDPMSAQYAAVTQADGSILLHLKNPDGTLGPAVKIIEPVKPRKAPGAPAQ